MITVHWDDDAQTIIRLDYSGNIDNWTEYRNAVQQGNEMALSKTGTVFFIHNPGKMKMPRNGNPVSEIRRAMQTVPPNVPVVVAVIENSFARSMVEAIVKVFSSTRLAESRQMVF